MSLLGRKHNDDAVERVDLIPAGATSSPSAIWTILPALALALVTAASSIAVSYSPPDTGQMAVVFPLFTDEQSAWQMVFAAGGSVVASSRFSNVVVAFAPDADFASRVRAAGGLFTLAARGLCEPLTPQTQIVSR